MQDSETSTQTRENPWAGQADGPAWRPVGERGLRLATGEATLALYETLLAGAHAELEDLIPTDDSLLLILRRGARLSDALESALRVPLGGQVRAPGRLHELPVQYGGALGPDLATLASRAGLHPDDYIHAHAAVEYRVAFLGFQPGFPYLRGLPQALHAPRRATPRRRVAAGSVAIGGAYTGIYPAAGPGGWQLIGCAEADLFDPWREPPCLLRPGDRVRFLPI